MYLVCAVTFFIVGIFFHSLFSTSTPKYKVLKCTFRSRLAVSLSLPKLPAPHRLVPSRKHISSADADAIPVHGHISACLYQSPMTRLALVGTAACSVHDGGSPTLSLSRLLWTCLHNQHQQNHMHECGGDHARLSCLGVMASASTARACNDNCRQ